MALLIPGATGAITLEHTCFCYGCRPGAYPPIPDEGAPYAAVRNWNMRAVPEWAQIFRHCAGHWCQVFLNGHRCTSAANRGRLPIDTTERILMDGVVEFLTGNPGWIIYAPYHPVKDPVRVGIYYEYFLPHCRRPNMPPGEDWWGCYQVAFGDVRAVHQPHPRCTYVLEEHSGSDA